MIKENLNEIEKSESQKISKLQDLNDIKSKFEVIKDNSIIEYQKTLDKTKKLESELKSILFQIKAEKFKLKNIKKSNETNRIGKYDESLNKIKKLESEELLKIEELTNAKLESEKTKDNSIFEFQKSLNKIKKLETDLESPEEKLEIKKIFLEIKYIILKSETELLTLKIKNKKSGFKNIKTSNEMDNSLNEIKTSEAKKIIKIKEIEKIKSEIKKNSEFRENLTKEIKLTEEKKIIRNRDEYKKIIVVGTGAFGTAIAESLQRDEKRGNEIVLFGINVREVNDINKNHKNSKYYALKLSSKLYASADPVSTFADADIIMLAVPSMAVKASLTKTIVPNLTKSAYFVNLAKGFDYLNFELLSTVIENSVPKELNDGVLKLAGASFASEVIHKQPTAFILAAKKIETAYEVYKELNNNTMKVIPSNSIEAVEWISIIKNALALLQGIVSGLGYKVNTRALFFTQAINEMRKLLKSQNLDESVIFSPAGIGDMYLTGSSRKSRNYSTGYDIGKANKVTKKSLQKFTTTEGLRSVEILLRMSRAQKINLKSIEILYEITYNKEKPSVVIENYLNKFNI